MEMKIYSIDGTSLISDGLSKDIVNFRRSLKT